MSFAVSDQTVVDFSDTISESVTNKSPLSSRQIVENYDGVYLSHICACGMFPKGVTSLPYVHGVTSV